MQMHKSSPSRVWSLSFLRCSVVVSTAVAGLMMGGADAAAGTTTPRVDSASAFQASGPHPSLGDHASTLARLVGAWDVDYTDFLSDSRVTHRTGQFAVEWILDGRALQDVWLVDPAAPTKEREVFTEVFWFNPKSLTWQVDSFDPYASSMATFVGGAVADDRIVVESRDLDPKATHRWSFNEIRPSSAVFRDEASTDGGKTWSLRSEYRMTRRAQAADRVASTQAPQ